MRCVNCKVHLTDVGVSAIHTRSPLTTRPLIGPPRGSYTAVFTKFSTSCDFTCVYYIEVYLGVLTVLLPGASRPSTDINNNLTDYICILHVGQDASTH